MILLVLECSPHLLDIPDDAYPEIQGEFNPELQTVKSKSILKLKLKTCSNTWWQLIP